MTEPLLLIDMWESGGKLDIPVLLANGVSGCIYRLNDMSGGHHMDDGFADYWKQAEAFPVRMVYFVYNPWKGGYENYEWLMSHLPLECGAVFIDLEVKYAGYSPSVYGAEVAKFNKLVDDAGLNRMSYTGQGYLEIMTPWDKGDYWWAAYPAQFGSYESMSWDELRKRLALQPTPANENKVPGSLKMWQFTGDRILLPGCSKVLDVNTYYGTLDELKSFANEKETIPDTENLPVLLSEREYFDGAIYRNYEIYMEHQGLTTYHVVEFEMPKMDIFVSPNPKGNNYVPKLMAKYDCDFAINGDGFTGNDIRGYAISSGQPYGTFGVEETIYAPKEGLLGTTRPPASLWNMAFSFPNVLVKDGIIPTINKADDYRARTSCGWNKDQSKFFVVVVDGKDYNEQVGMTFKETAKVLQDLGCWFAVMLDGGGSTTLSVMDNGVPTLLNKSYGEEVVAGYPYKMRPVAQIIGFIMKIESIPEIPTGDVMLKVIKTGASYREAASMYSANMGSVPLNMTFETKGTVTGTNFLKPADYGVTFEQAPNGYWIPRTYKGVTYLADVVVTPPANGSAKPAKAVVTLDDGTVWEATNFTKVG